MIIDRENEIRNFKPEEYWSIEADFLKGTESFKGKFYGVKGKKQDLKNENDVKSILSQLTEKNFTVQKVNKRERRRNPAKPFITSTLQQEAARKLNLREWKTMMIAQHIYEGIHRKITRL